MQKILNLKVKFRESFRPFAPSILNEDSFDWFESTNSSPYMMVVSELKKEKRIKIQNSDEKLFGIEKLNNIRSKVPAITHVDYTARIQTVHADTNRKFYLLIKEFKKQTGYPLIVNTSFNIRGEPIVCSPEDAFRCFMGTEIDFLVICNYLLNKNEQNYNLIKNYKAEFKLD